MQRSVLFALVAFALVALCASAAIELDGEGDDVEDKGQIREKRSMAEEVDFDDGTVNAHIRNTRGGDVHGSNGDPEKQKGRGNVFNWNVDASSAGKPKKAKKEEEDEGEK